LFADCFECHVSVIDACKAVDLLADTSGLSKQAVKQAMQKGAVWITNGKSTRRLRRAGKVLDCRDVVHLYYNKQVFDSLPQPAQLIADEQAYSVWLKPQGMLCQGSKWGDHCTINRWVEQHLVPHRPAFIVHRLDRATSGLIIISHQKSTATALADLFQSRAIDKRYKALVRGHFEPDNQPMHIRDAIEGRSASSVVSLLNYDMALDQSLLDVKINTGRKHQIRRHLSGIGFPIIGDRLYGNAAENPTEESVDLQLTAYYLSFQCPLTGEVKQYEI